ncbi:MAG TPA: hypothetical protein DCF63_16925, partial [Planctomycetaceae bacterium]|nr:hypothetical protein [Planctomycetaceae bacterium]
MFVLAFLGSLNQFAESEADERLTDAELSEVLNRHESAIALVHSADVTVNVQSTEREGVQQTPPVAMWMLRWSKDGSKSRIRCENLHSSAVDERGDSVRRFVDVLEDGHKINMLLNWDPIKRPALQARDQRSVQAYTYPPSPQLPGLVVNLLQQHALFEIGANAFDARRSIRQLIAQSPGKGDARVVEIEGQKLIALKIDHPDTKFGKTFKNTRFEIYIDPAFNHLVRRVVVLTPPNEKIGAKTG